MSDDSTVLEEENNRREELEEQMLYNNLHYYDYLNTEDYEAYAKKKGLDSSQVFGTKLCELLKEYNLFDDISENLGIVRRIELKEKSQDLFSTRPQAYYYDLDDVEVSIPTYLWKYDMFTDYYLDGDLFYSEIEKVEGYSNENTHNLFGANGMFNLAFSNADGELAIVYKKKKVGSTTKYIKTDIESDGSLKGSKKIFGFPRYLEELFQKEAGLSYKICEHYKEVFGNLVTEHGLTEFQTGYNAFENLAATREELNKKR